MVLTENDKYKELTEFDASVLEDGIERIPQILVKEQYILEEKKSNSNISNSNRSKFSLPVIDLGCLNRARIIKQVKDACQEWGFFQIVNHGIASSLMNRVVDVVRKFHKLDAENPLTLMSYVTPVMELATAIGSMIFDPWHEFRQPDYFNSSWHIVRSCLLMFFGGTLAFFMVLTDYILVSVTSAVTVTIAGVVKEAVTILVAVLYFHDEFTWLKGAGLLTIMFGVSLFNWYKYDKLHKGETSSEPSTDGAASKYVILDEIDDEDSP